MRPPAGHLLPKKWSCLKWSWEGEGGNWGCFVFRPRPGCYSSFQFVFYRSGALSSIKPPTSLIINTLHVCSRFLMSWRNCGSASLDWFPWVSKFQGRMLLLKGDCSICYHRVQERVCVRVCVSLCVCACAHSLKCLMSVLHQLRQVSQAKRWDDVGTGRRTIRQSRLIESLEFPDEEYGVNLGIVSVRSQVANTRVAAAARCRALGYKLKVA